VVHVDGARRANVSLEQCRAALACFEAPDPDSKDPDHEGRRIERVAGGFVLLNYEKYRERRSSTQIKTAERVQRWRQRQAEANGQLSVTCNAGNAEKRAVRTEVEREAKEDLEVKEKREREADPERSSLSLGRLTSDEQERLNAIGVAHAEATNVPLHWTDVLIAKVQKHLSSLLPVPVADVGAAYRHYIAECKKADRRDPIYNWSDVPNFCRNFPTIHVHAVANGKAPGLTANKTEPWKIVCREDRNHRPMCLGEVNCNARADREDRQREIDACPGGLAEWQEQRRKQFEAATGRARDGRVVAS
jgi:hypothetical protein